MATKTIFVCRECKVTCFLTIFHIPKVINEPKVCPYKNVVKAKWNKTELKKLTDEMFTTDEFDYEH